MAGEYASRTDVPVSKSRDEIERTLSRFGATKFAYMADPPHVAIAFEVHGLRIVMKMELPGRDQFLRNSYGNQRAASAIEKDWEQSCRQRWRTLGNAIKAKLASIDDGISTVEQEFLAFVALPGEGGTVGDRIIPEMRETLRRGDLPSLMPGLPPAGRVIELSAGTGR